ncbi:hypothetical protein B1H10_01210 [candidate division KSB1 bacterium 4484_188]|nr:MAG: hypothetical protein B1H10_01210 [candidate division KSB1 bacterium 4484_188]
MILWFSVPAKVAVATSLLMVGLTGLLGFSGHLFTGQINWLLSIGVGAVWCWSANKSGRIFPLNCRRNK